MPQTQETMASATLDALRAALTSGQMSALREVKADAVLLDEANALPELLRLCGLIEAGHNLALMNAAWKLLLSVSSLNTISPPVYSGILQFMLSQLHHHVFSHDWSDAKKIKLASFVASHVVSAVRAHPFIAARDERLVQSIVGLHAIVCLTVATSGHKEAAQQLHQCIVVRLLAILEAMGSSFSASSPLSGGEHLRLLLQCLADPPPAATAELATASVAAGSSVAALAAMLAATRSFQVCDRAYVERILAAFLLWLPDMQLVFSDVAEQEETTEAAETTVKTVLAAPCDKDPDIVLCHRIVRHARNLPRAVFFPEQDDDGAAESSGEVHLNAQLLLLLRSLACRSVDAIRGGEWCDKEGSPGGGSLLRCRVFSLLMTALLVPNDTSAARVLLVWEAVLSRLSNADREGLGVELLQLGEEQLRALRELPAESRDRATCLRRLLNALAVLLTEICRQLQRPPKSLYGSFAETTATRISSLNPTSFCTLVNVLYHQSSVYQWWNERSIPKEEVLGGTEEEAKAIHDQLRAVLTEWQDYSSLKINSEMASRICIIIASVPERVHNILERTNSPKSITAVLLIATKVLQKLAEELNTSYAICECARFVAAELVAVTGFVLSEDPTFLACIRRLVDISFALTEDGKEVRVDGMLRYHAAVCLRNFAQRNAVVPLGQLRLSEAVTTALRVLLQGGDVADTDFSMRDCEGFLAHRLEEWKSLLSRSGHAAKSSQSAGSLVEFAPHATSTFSQSVIDGHEGQFFLPLQRSEDTVRSVLRWLKAGRALQPSEEETLVRLEQLACAAANMTRHALSSNGDVFCSSADIGAGATQTTGLSPEIINVD
ncbi:hypothetical protein C3747_88g205 [Trypanosoma cruzi]|uniref:Uncharacterized protein n=2 Tax=Trypanosoma cruzi TaxID=5693 RepID=Q4CPQ5_TRYCC|nr:hypothetical protein, conserved [Trypanosoma cruzi]EAN82256.1 hypothetical protein, conserved [Trypanosoma cruzi]PWV08597.1 hypothetical protein C3747_88g205 [Trypanosoma cruzi]RNC57253.1 hypothetical protein TcCL_ESM05173 [Trypanosoma cruzi]|eukprot:XP_804107.1 hypothetical protein [Trypanosoma cruzi strain CL Brener]